MQNAATVMYLNRHAPGPCIQFEIIKTWNQQLARKLAVRHTNSIILHDLSVIFSKIPWLFHEWNIFVIIHDFHSSLEPSINCL